MFFVLVGSDAVGTFVSVSNGSDQKTLSAAEVLIRELNHDGITTEHAPPPSANTPNWIRITIGIKPQK